MRTPEQLREEPWICTDGHGRAIYTAEAVREMLAAHRERIRAAEIAALISCAISALSLLAIVILCV